MTDRNDGGPAYPLVAENPPYHVEDGMSLRDYFAGQALQGMMVSEGTEGQTWGSCRDVAGAAFRYADAMLEERRPSDAD